jgi:uncharacterized protein (DUF488 family)
MAMQVWTVGHSTHSIEAFLALLVANAIEQVADEALWWRCHRRPIADRPVVAGDTVCHIGSTGGVSAHELTPFATVAPDGRIAYPAAGAAPL